VIANVSAHRRANAFAQALENETLQGTAAQQPEPAGRQDSECSTEEAEQTRLLALARGLSRAPSPQLDPEVKVVQRAQLVAAMEAMSAGNAAGTARDPQVPEQRSRKGAHRSTSLRKPRQGGRWSKLAAGGLTVGVAAGAFSGVAAASSDALPGDSLYPLKLGMEDFELGMADDDTDRGQLYLDQASARLSEARRLMERGRLGDFDHESLGEIRRTLSEVCHDADQGHRLLHRAFEKDGSLAPIQALTAFSDSHRESWGRMRDRMPAQLTDVSDEVNGVFEAIEQEIEPLRGMLPVDDQSESGSTAERPGSTQDTGNGASASFPAASQGIAGKGSGTQPSDSGGSSSREDENRDDLLGGTDGSGLLGPPKQTSPSPSGGTGKAPAPDITIPPVLNDLLPGLDINDKDAD
jgi:hypothetical protein